MYEHKSRKKGFFNEFTVLGVFIAIAAAGLVYGGIMAMTGGGILGAAVEPAEPSAAPGADAYRQQAKAALSPFLAAVASSAPDVQVPVDDALRGEVSRARDALLALLVPKEEQGAHLTLVLLLDQWKRSLDGSAADRSAVMRKTNETLDQYAWLK